MIILFSQPSIHLKESEMDLISAYLPKMFDQIICMSVGEFDLGQLTHALINTKEW